MEWGFQFLLIRVFSATKVKTAPALGSIENADMLTLALGAGYVVNVGKKVTKVKPGDSVLLSFAFCGKCHNCEHGAPGYCAQFTPLNFCGNPKAFELPGSGKDRPAVGGSFFGQSSFSNLTRVQETSVVRMTDLVKNEADLKLFAPLGCGIQVGHSPISPSGVAPKTINAFTLDWCGNGYRDRCSPSIGQGRHHRSWWCRSRCNNGMSLEPWDGLLTKRLTG